MSAIPIAIGACIILGMVLGAWVVLGFHSEMPKNESPMASLQAQASRAIDHKDATAGRRIKAEMEAMMHHSTDASPVGFQVAYHELKDFLEHGTAARH